MQLKKRWTCIGFLFVLLPVTAYAQMDLYELQQGRKEAGLGFSRGQDAIGIGGRLGYGISDRTKIALIANMSILDEDRYDSSEVNIPPPVMIGIESVHVSPLGQTGLDYFFIGDFYTAFTRTLEASTNETLASALSAGLAGGGGISKRIQTNFGWTLNPFCGVSYSRSWTRLDIKGASEGTERNRTYSGFGGRVGLDVELSPAVSVRGGFGVSFTDFDKGTERNRASFDFGGHVGLDVELSPAVSVRGGSLFYRFR